MEKETITEQFKKAGFRVKIADLPAINRLFRSNTMRRNIVLDVKKDKKGEYFEIQLNPENGTLTVLDCRPKLRHLLIMFRQDKESSRYLCGHDERHLFVCAIPENCLASSVNQAKDALNPSEVIMTEESKGVKTKERYKRKNKAYVRQGEWFFIPVSDLIVDKKLIHKNEPIVRGRGKPHVCAELYREGGETVFVNSRIAPNGLTIDEFKDWQVKNPSSPLRDSSYWRRMQRNARVYVRGAVRHPDHATVTLNGWHRVVPNTENLAKGFQNLAFLD